MLIPAEELAPLTAEVRARVARELPSIVVEPGELGDMLAWGLLFEHWPELLSGTPIGHAAAFYNQYFWIRRYASAKQRRDGEEDGGLEQYVHTVLEQADFEVDWELLEELHDIANRV